MGNLHRNYGLFSRKYIIKLSILNILTKIFTILWSDVARNELHIMEIGIYIIDNIKYNKSNNKNGRKSHGNGKN